MTTETRFGVWFVWDGVGGYSAERDSYIIKSVFELDGPPIPGSAGGEVGSTFYQFSGGTFDPNAGHPQIRYLIAPLAHIVAPTGAAISYDAIVSRQGLNYHFLGTVPEPSTALLVACGLVGLGLRRRRR